MLNPMSQTLITAIAEQEKSLVLPSFNKETAWQLGNIARDLATKRNHAIAIEVRAYGATVFLTALDGTVPNSMRWLTRKSNSVALFDRATYGLSLNLALKNQTIARHALPEAEYTSDGGGFPIRVANAGLIGSIAISGLDQRSDHELAVETLCMHLNLDYKQHALPA